MKKYNWISGFFNWIHVFTGGFVATADEFTAFAVMDEDLPTRNLCFSGMIKDNIAFACNAFYRQKKLSGFPPDLMYMACQYFEQNDVVIDSQGVFSFNRFNVSNTTDDGGIYSELPTGYEMFDIEEALILIAEIVILWTSDKNLARKTTLKSLKSIAECGFFMMDDDAVPWTIRLIKNDGQPIVTMHEFDETDDMWPKHSVVLSPLSPGDENYLHSLES